MTKTEVSIILFLVVLINFGLAAFVLWKGPRKKTNRLFACVGFSVAMWASCHAMTLLAKDNQTALFWTRLIMVGGILLPSLFAWFTKVIGTEDYRPSRAVIILNVGIVAFFLSFLFHPSMVRDAKIESWGIDWEFGPTYTLYCIYYALLMGHGMFVLLGKIRKAEGNYRRQLIFVFIGTSIAILFALVVNLILVLIGIDRFNKYGPFGTLIMMSFFAYAIVHYQLMEVRVFFRRAGLLILVYGILLAITAPLAFIWHQRALANYGAPGGLFVMEIVIITSILSLGPFIYAYIIRQSSYFHEHTMAGLTHELKSPLATIENALEILTELSSQAKETAERGEKEKRQAEYLEMIERNVTRLKKFTDDLLQVYKVPQKKTSLEIHSTNVTQLVENVVEGFSSQASQKELSLRVDKPEKDIHAACDPEKISQVVSNLLSNAIKFSDNGEIAIRIRTNHDHVQIEVQDHGRGIPVKEAPQVFERFFQGRAGQKQKGTGIGLAIAKAWVKAHGGKIWAESDGEGKGTTVIFTLPLT